MRLLLKSLGPDVITGPADYSDTCLCVSHSAPTLDFCTSIPRNATALIYKTINSDQFSHLQTPILAIRKHPRLWKGKSGVMAELKRIDEEFPAAELATDGIPPKQPEGPKLVKG
jgi:hypothetical protein